MGEPRDGDWSVNRELYQQLKRAEENNDRLKADNGVLRDDLREMVNIVKASGGKVRPEVYARHRWLEDDERRRHR